MSRITNKTKWYPIEMVRMLCLMEEICFPEEYREYIENMYEKLQEYENADKVEE